MRKISIFTIVIIALLACDTKKIKQSSDALSLSGDTIYLSTDSHILEKLKTETIRPKSFRIEIFTFGIVKAIPNKYAEIAAPFAGRITRSFVKLGQHVQVNGPVFEISSPYFYEASKLYYQAKQEMMLAKKNLKRQQDLYKNGVGIQKDLEEAEVNYELNKRDYENAIASLKVYKVNPEDLVLGQPLIVRSPIAGDVVKNKIVIGQYLKEDADPVALVAELDKVWIIGQVKEKDINSIHKSEEVEITAPPLGDRAIKGSIYHISDMLDEQTRSVQVYIECDNPDHILKPGMYVSVKFIEQPRQNIIIPSTSVFQKEDGNYVFVKEDQNRYIRRDVEIKGVDENRMLVTSGLNPGEHIVTEGGYFLLEYN